jgi:hypothetical protein
MTTKSRNTTESLRVDYAGGSEYAIREPETTNIVETLEAFVERARNVQFNVFADHPDGNPVCRILDSFNSIYFVNLEKSPPAAYPESAMIEDLVRADPGLAGLWLKLKLDLSKWAAGCIAERIDGSRGK